MSALWQTSTVHWRSLPPCPHNRRSQAFTLVELLVSVGIIGVLTSMLAPAIVKAKSKTHTTTCAANMKQWAYATQLYTSDFDDRLPPFGDQSTDYTKPFWHAKLAPYLGKETTTNTFFRDTAIYRDDLRRCPAGRPGPPPYAPSSTNIIKWNCWVGAHFGLSAKPLTGPFYYADTGPALCLSRIAKPYDAMSFMDSVTHYIYSPVDEHFRFTLDVDGDGVPDTSAAYDHAPYNSARPTVHDNGANVTLLDGHVERVAFKSFWKIDSAGRVANSFWYLED